MSELFYQVITFILLSAGMLSGLLLYVYYKNGFSSKKYKQYWNHSEGDKSIWKGIGLIIGVPALIGILLFTFHNASASEIKYFDHATVYMGLDNTLNPSPFCSNEGINNRITSNMGFTQNLVKKDMFSFNAKYTHHSCAVNPDSDTAYDSVGIFLEWRIY